MIGLLLITHGQFGKSLVENVCHILGKAQPMLVPLGILADDDPEAARRIAKRMLAELDHGRGVLILTDILGATPSNIARQLLIPGRVESVAGVNLPMLLRAVCYREKEMETLIEKVLSGGHDSITRMYKHNHDGQRHAS